MRENATPVWIIHMGRPGGEIRGNSLELAERIANSGYVATGWPELGDLARLPNDRGAFRDAVAEQYGPGASSRTVAGVAGILYRFVHSMKTGDVVVMPLPKSGGIRVGRVSGEFVFRPMDSDVYPQQRSVDWLTTVPRATLSDEAQRSLRGQMSCYAARQGADEFRRIASEYQGQRS